MSTNDVVTAVTGSTRCGTTLLMRMLHAGGIPAYADNLVSFETTRIHSLPGDAAWLEECRGRAVKLLEPLYLVPLPRLPWRFVLMRRDPVQQARSQIKFMRLVGGVPAIDLPDSIADKLAASLVADLPRMRNVLKARGPMLELAFGDVLADPVMAAERVQSFLDVPLDTTAMVRQVVPRAPECLDGLLEMRFVEREASRPGLVRPRSAR